MGGQNQTSYYVIPSETPRTGTRRQNNKQQGTSGAIQKGPTRTKNKKGHCPISPTKGQKKKKKTIQGNHWNRQNPKGLRGKAERSKKKHVRPGPKQRAKGFGGYVRDRRRSQFGPKT